MQEILFKLRYFEKGLSKSFFLHPVPFNGQDYEKQKLSLELVTSHSSKQVPNIVFHD